MRSYVHEFPTLYYLVVILLLGLSCKDSAQMHSQATLQSGGYSFAGTLLQRLCSDAQSGNSPERAWMEATLRKMKAKRSASAGERRLVLSRTILLLCACSFVLGMLFTDRFRAMPDLKSQVVVQLR